MRKQTLFKATTFVFVCLLSTVSIAKWPQKKPTSPPSQISKPALKMESKNPKASSKKEKVSPKKEELKAKQKPAKDAKLRLDPRTGVLSLVGPNKNILAATRCSKGHCEGIEPKGGFLSYDFDKGKIKNFVFKDYLGKSHNVKVVYSHLGYHLILNGKRFGALGWNSKSAFFEIDLSHICWSCLGEKNKGLPTVQPPIYHVITCGDGRTDRGEECDYTDRSYTPPAGFSCNTRCHLIPTCTDGNDPHCWLLCGNGVVDPGEECDFLSSDPLTCDFSCYRRLPQCYGCNTRGLCEETPLSVGATDCGAFSAEPTCGGSCPYGISIPPPDESIALCTLPVADRPADSQVREYPGYTLISQCATDTSVRYTFCGREGDVTDSIGECPSRQICRNGGCVDAGPAPGEPFCIDTDEADDSHVRGNIVGIDDTGNPFSRVDTCDGEDAVYESICSPAWDYRRRYLCPAEEHCEGGICVLSPSCEPTCVDSDSEDDVHVFGRTNVVDEICGSLSFTDRCDARYTDRTSEGHCIENRFMWLERICPTGEICRDGICTDTCERRCTDTDPDENVHIRGSTTTTFTTCGTNTLFDDCVGSRRVRQVSCTPAGFETSVDISCPEGEHCASGTCRPYAPPLCMRTEPATTPGYVTAADGTIQHDICDGSTVQTYVCGSDGQPTDVGGSRIPCPNGCRVNEDGLAIGLCNP